MPDPEFEKPGFVLEVEPLDLGEDVKAVGLELMEVDTREPAQGAEAAQIWAAVLSGLAGSEPWTLDFFAHLDRVREYCARHSVGYAEKASSHVLAISGPAPETLADLVDRFAGETFGARAGLRSTESDPGVENELARHGIDAYHAAFRDYLFCAVCDFENGFLTLLTEKLWASEVIRRIKATVASLPVEVARPH